MTISLFDGSESALVADRGRLRSSLPTELRKLQAARAPELSGTPREAQVGAAGTVGHTVDYARAHHDEDEHLKLLFLKLTAAQDNMISYVPFHALET